jgi:hypothetical protein
MSRDGSATRYFAVGFFTPEQLEEKHRAMLARAQNNAPIPKLRSAVEAVTVTVFDVDTGTETVELGINPVSLVVPGAKVQASGVSFAIERFEFTTFPGTLSPEDAFAQYLSSAEGIASFGTATAVQLFAINVGGAAKDPAKSYT